MLCPINESVIKSGFDGIAKEIGSIKHKGVLMDIFKSNHILIWSLSSTSQQFSHSYY
jgi:hypothetical protein